MSDGMIFGLGFAGAGVVCAIPALFFLIRTRRFIQNSYKTQATVTQIVYDGDTDSAGYIPVFHFKTLQGQEVEGRGDFRADPPEYKVGQTIEVLYDLENPSRARIKKWTRLYFVAILFGFLAVLFALIGIAAIVAAWFGYY